MLNYLVGSDWSDDGTDDLADASLDADQAKRDAARAFGAGRVLDLIATGESAPGNAGYDTVYGYKRFLPPGSKPPSQMTLAEWKKLSKDMVRNGGGSAIGRYQFMPSTLATLQPLLAIGDADVMTPELQDRMARELLRRRRYDDFLDGKITAEQFQERLAPEWRSIEYRDGRSYDGKNPMKVSGEQLRQVLAQAKAEADAARARGERLQGTPWR